MATQYSVSPLVTSLTAGAVKTVIELNASASAGITFIGLDVSFNATAAGSCVVEFNNHVTTGTGTTFVPLKYGTGQGVAANLTSCKTNNTVEPATPTTAGLPHFFIPYPGMYSVLLPAGREFFRAASTLTCLRLTSTLTCLARVNLYFEQ